MDTATAAPAAELFDNAAPPAYTPDAMAHIDALLAVLPPQTFSLVQRYFGLDGEAPQTAAQLAAATGLAPEEVEDQVVEALASLRSADPASRLN